jgi:hypothetical protein
VPSIVAVPYPTRGHVLVEVNLADVSGAVYACVEAVTGAGTDTEVRRQLHSYVSYNSDGCIALSCGQAIFWDTEVSCDVATQYCVTAINAAGDVITQPADALMSATFSVVAAASWPPADTGQTFTNTGGAAADYSGTGTRGQHAVTSTAVLRVSSAVMTTANAVAQIQSFPTVVAATQPIEQHLWLRADAAGANGYRARVRYNTAGTVDLILERVVAGVATSLGSLLAPFTYIAATGVSVKLQTWGSSIAAKIWEMTTPEPLAYQVTATDTTITSVGLLAASSLRAAGNTNGTVNMQFDNLLVEDVCADLEPVTLCTEEFTLECDGCFRLGDPVRPCNDVRVCLCVGGVECGGTGGLFFAGMSADIYAANSGNLLPVNAKYPIVVSRTRRSAAGQIDIVATSFDERDDLLDLLDPGGPLLWRGPAEFGTGDRYISVGDVPVAPQISDLTIQPRMMPLPFLATKAPLGPTLGVCGSRVKDLCDIYDTWAEMVAAGLTWADLLRGEASTPGSGLATWNDINADNVDWAALQVAETDWTDVLDGD